ncbi:SANT/Myb domain [Arabidopsis thaliana x Arabidopsis arenosa]|uniref:MYB transcription factor n=2 Tax=Arabidopsis TaxID=3701 RepID=A0A8T2CDC5_ARASU|nr:SANT/Myb domain [Arabidopsis thaliana x Arabidopsis arenosa]KAG7597375.1 SANT/Myb domain [Arabidopsis suecica]
MGNQKLKWTAEEEEALLAGVGKHGPGKWKNILRDPEFAEQLSSRSNIDLKDKWRNLSVAPGIQGSKDKIRTPKIKAAAFHLASAAAAAILTPPHSAHSSPVAVLPRSGSSDLSIDDSFNIVVDPKNAPRYDGMIFEALSALTDANGSDVSAIFNFIEQQRHEVPPNFRRILSSRLRRLAAQGKLEKVSHLKSTQNFYKMNDNSLVTRPTLVARPKESNTKARQQANSQGPSISQQMVAEASITAAYKLVEVENKLDVSKGASEEIYRLIKLAEDADDMLVIAREMHEECSQGKIMYLN